MASMSTRSMAALVINAGGPIYQYQIGLVRKGRNTYQIPSYEEKQQETKVSLYTIERQSRETYTQFTHRLLIRLNGPMSESSAGDIESRQEWQ
jgi:hypothetical protein